MSIASRASSSLISSELANAIADAVEAAESSTVAPATLTPEAVFQHAIDSAIGAIEAKGQVLRDFLLRRPYTSDLAPGALPPVSDEECAVAITMLYSHVVNCFKGELAEMLALAPVTQLLKQLSEDGVIPPDSRLFVGDTVRPRGGNATAKGADFHVLTISNETVRLIGVGEVKSFVVSPARLAPQLSKHIQRALKTIVIAGATEEPLTVAPSPPPSGVIRISVSLGGWRLPRGYHFEERDGRSFLHSDPLPPIPGTEITEVSPHHWHIVLGWSQEALSAEAYGLTFWYMEQLGADLFATNPSPWPEMSPAAAGVNAATEALFHSIHRCSKDSVRQRAVALYNAQGFGYSLGTSYKDAKGRRQMLWPKDLREMLLCPREGREAWLHD